MARKYKKRFKGGYRHIGYRLDICMYCGMQSEELDHALPFSRRNSIVAIGRVLIPSCHECNSMLAGSLQETVGERIKEVKKRLRKKYKRYLSIPTWSLDDLEGIEGNLVSDISRSIAVKELIIHRLAFDFFLWVKLGRPNSLLP